MLQAIGLLEGGFGGRIEIAGIDASRLGKDQRAAVRRDHIGFVYQFHHLLPDFNAIENVVPLYALIQSRTVENERARVIAANNILNALFMVVSAIVSKIGRASCRERVCQYV